TCGRESLVSVTTDTVLAVAHRILEDAPLYNAAKHGFAVLAEHMAVEFRAELRQDETPEERSSREAAEKLVRSEGVALEALEWTYDSASKSRHWFTALRFVDPAHDLALGWLTVRVL